MAGLPPFASRTADGVALRLKVVPGASRDAVAGILGDRLKVRVAAPPEGGKANAAVLALLARALGCKDLRLIAGAASVEKTVLLPGRAALTPDQLAELP